MHLITGGSSGIGRALIQKLVESGEQVVSIGRSKPIVDCQWVEADLLDIEELPTLKGPFKSIVFCAAMQERHRTQWDWHEWKLHMEVNCFSQAALFEKLDQENSLIDFPYIVVMGSKASEGSVSYPAYGMSKAAFWTYWRCKYLQRNRRLAVNQLWPGRVATPGNPRRAIDDLNGYRDPTDIVPTILWLMGLTDEVVPVLQTIDLGVI